MAAPWGWDWTPPTPEAQRETTDGVLYCVDWQRRRLLPAFNGTTAGLCLHGEALVIWCEWCEKDLDALARELLP